ncbi:MAG TPA: hypothetical protein VNW29_07980 [Candidatus Sulfotelmatobacter sp.]|jgi:hypothetical protein|nr:hypothetical protein [Candidatus Sulfotelmatobacter sp.]
MADSRLNNTIKRKAIHNVLIVLFGIIVIIVIIVVFGSKLLIGFSLLVGKMQGSNNDSSTIASQQNDTFIAPPTLNPISKATNKNQIDVSGFAQKNQSVNLYVNNQMVDKQSVGSDNRFHFSSIALQPGQNTIKSRAETSTNKESDYSNIDTISYLKNPPSLSITQPQDGQGFSKSSSPTLSIEGQTDPGSKITVNSSWAIVDDQGKYSYLYTLKDGDNDIKVVATDDASNQTTKEIHIHTQ